MILEIIILFIQLPWYNNGDQFSSGHHMILGIIIIFTRLHIILEIISIFIRLPYNFGYNFNFHPVTIYYLNLDCFSPLSADTKGENQSNLKFHRVTLPLVLIPRERTNPISNFIGLPFNIGKILNFHPFTI